MTFKHGKKIQVFITYIVFCLSSICIFNPIYTSGNVALSVLCAIICAYAVFETSVFMFSRQDKHSPKCIPVYTSLSLICAVLSICISLIYLTEVIKDVAHIAGRGVSLLYYTFLSIALLCVSCYLCFNSQKGIYRFLILTLSPILIFVIIMGLGFFTTKAFFLNNVHESRLSAITTGMYTGIFLSIDSCIFISTFKESTTDEQSKIFKNALRLSFTVCALIFSAICLIPHMLFGTRLTNSLSDAQYSAVKLFYPMDMTEILSAVRIIAFLIKSSIYIYAASCLLKGVFKTKKVCQKKILFTMYALIPIIFIFLALFDSTLKYGAFQYMIYPAVYALGICFILIKLICKRTN